MQFCRFSTPTREDAQDLFQNIWVAFFDAFKKDKKIKNIKFNLYKTAHYKVMQRHREYQNKPKVFEKNIDSDNIISPTNLIEEIENQELISNFILHLNALILFKHSI